ncbi:MAG: MarR family transcriptional regulator [Cocleimonas sp.]
MGYTEEKLLLKKEREFSLLELVKETPGITAYHISKKLDVAYGSIERIIRDLLENNFIKIIEIRRRGHTRKTIHLNTK